MPAERTKGRAPRHDISGAGKMRALHGYPKYAEVRAMGRRKYSLAKKRRIHDTRGKPARKVLAKDA